MQSSSSLGPLRGRVDFQRLNFLENALQPVLQLPLRPRLALCPGKFAVIGNRPPVEIGGLVQQFNLLIVLRRCIVIRHIFILSECAPKSAQNPERNAVALLLPVPSLTRVK